jgi:hypothetical protein
MNHVITFRTFLACLLLAGTIGLQAQQDRISDPELSTRLEADKRIDDYLKLVKLGYSEREIYEDLGNANFLSENYETAAFWYQKLIDLSGAEAVPSSYVDRYKYAQHKAGIVSHTNLVAERDWFSKIEEDYQIERSSHAVQLTQTLAANYRMPEFGRSGHQGNMDGLNALRAMSEAELDQMQSNKIGIQNAYLPPVAVTANGQIAYFSKAVYVKPLTGLFSKKQLVHKLYRAERINGEWKRVQELPVAPKYASAMHPAISPDGQRLYFASDMPGTFGKYDIYVADIHSDGKLGTARNLGEKINTRKNDLYPTLVGSDILFFASDGREGYGGLDLYAARIARQSVGLAINIGSPFNSRDDEFALNLKTDKGMAHVMSNRGAPADDVRELVFSYYDTDKNSLAENRYSFMEIISIEPDGSYAETHFED